MCVIRQKVIADNMQFGFRLEKGTTSAVFTIKQMMTIIIRRKKNNNNNKHDNVLVLSSWNT